MTLDRTTKGTYRYAEDNEEIDEMAFRTLYIRKHVFPGEPPQQIEITVRALK